MLNVSFLVPGIATRSIGGCAGNYSLQPEVTGAVIH